MKNSEKRADVLTLFNTFTYIYERIEIIRMMISAILLTLH